MPIFRFPFMYNPNFYNNFKSNNNGFTPSIPNKNENKDTYKEKVKETNSNKKNDTYLFELFGLKLYYDDILIICLLLFLYNEGNKDEELFLILILLLLS